MILTSYETEVTCIWFNLKEESFGTVENYIV